jgi:hypothetical protein
MVVLVGPWRVKRLGCLSGSLCMYVISNIYKRTRKKCDKDSELSHLMFTRAQGVRPRWLSQSLGHRLSFGLVERVVSP